MRTPDLESQARVGVGWGGGMCGGGRAKGDQQDGETMKSGARRVEAHSVRASRAVKLGTYVSPESALRRVGGPAKLCFEQEAGRPIE